jgi:hypothetical protein
MPNLRIIYDNEADSATIAASTTASGFSTSNMQNEHKTQVHRSTGTTVVYTLVWSSAVVVGAVALPATNLTGDSTIRVELFSDAGATVLLQDSGTISAAPGLVLDLWDWAEPLNANSFAYGGYAKTTVWFENQQGSVLSCKITLTDTTNSAGYIDCAKIVAGSYWEPTHNLEKGYEQGLVDTSVLSRTESGNLIADRGIIHEKVKFDFALLPESDRSQLNLILRRIGTSQNFLISLLALDESNTAEQDLIIYGKRSNSFFNNRTYSYYKHSMDITGW